MSEEIMYMPTLPSTFNSLVGKTIKIEIEQPQYLIESVKSLNTYANELRYALIYAVFVTPIQLQIHHMSHTIRTPRQIKVADPKGSFDMQLRKQLEKTAYEWTIGNGKKRQGKKTINTKGKRAIEENLNMKVGPPTPPSSLTDEEILANNRRFILPLIEAKEAAQIYEMHAETMK
ncbi:hypothetical protein EAG_12050 [Camponotus floridanus]|uniref:Uncharacterized protein n=1 Tax=Camponotus floridanus TaxID=104421 RepID=E2AS44_CAMFO|nr:hypothetical protein EAG_12050 [Camponotus floridanus]